jgi:hypothetical protein
MFFIQKIIANIFVPLLHIFNLSFINGIIPQQLKIAKIVPVFKSGDSTNVDNYRPISLSNYFSKIIEKMLLTN